MKVKELIEELKKLDQDKGIWIIYDGFLPIKPEVDDVIQTEEDAEYYSRYSDGEDVKVGDYVITC